MVAAFLLFNPWLVARRGMKTGAMLMADDTHFVYESDFVRSDIPWPKFFRVRAGSDFLMLYVSAHQFFIVARRFFASDADWESFRTLATTKVPVFKRRSIIKLAALWLLIIVGVFVAWVFFQR